MASADNFFQMHLWCRQFISAIFFMQTISLPPPPPGENNGPSPKYPEVRNTLFSNCVKTYLLQCSPQTCTTTFFCSVKVFVNEFLFLLWVKVLRHRCQFNQKWLLDSCSKTWITEAETSSMAKCLLCRTSFDISTMGISALVSHQSGKKHKEVFKKPHRFFWNVFWQVQQVQRHYW